MTQALHSVSDAFEHRRLYGLRASLVDSLTRRARRFVSAIRPSVIGLRALRANTRVTSWPAIESLGRDYAGRTQTGDANPSLRAMEPPHPIDGMALCQNQPRCLPASASHSRNRVLAVWPSGRGSRSWHRDQPVARPVCVSASLRRGYGGLAD